LASEGIEIVRNMIDSEYINGKEFGDSLVKNEDCAVDIDTEPAYLEGGLSSWHCGDDFLMFDPDRGLYSLDSSDSQQTKFRRRVFVSEDAGIIKVTSTVEWASTGGRESTVVLEDRFYNWRRAS
jgi:hypothetical protein